MRLGWNLILAESERNPVFYASLATGDRDVHCDIAGDRQFNARALPLQPSHKTAARFRVPDEHVISSLNLNDANITPCQRRRGNEIVHCCSPANRKLRNQC